MALLAFAPEPSQAGPGKVCLDGTSALSACKVGTIGTYYANSPALRKFVDTLPGLTAGHANTFARAGNQGEYISVAVADTTTYPGSEYFVIGVVEHAQWMHSELQKPTTQRSYVQLYPKLSERPAGSTNPPAKAVDTLTGQVLPAPVALTYPDGKPITWPGTNGEQVYAYDKPHYLGPIILTTSGTPVRVKAVNFLPTGTATLDAAGHVTARNGDMFLPVDESISGAGLGPVGDRYSQNRVAFHLHGGDSPWISDGTPHQWMAAAGDPTPYKVGSRFTNVPDMPYPGDGAQTIYWPNNQSARLMWFHDHTFGLTRQNAYSGAAAGYVIIDPAELALVNGGVITANAGNAVNINKVLPGKLLDQIVLIIQDKTWVPNDIANQDSKWDQSAWGKPGDLWFPHVYEPNQLWGANASSTAIATPAALNPAGRWDYAVDDATGTYLVPKMPVHADADYGDVTFPDGSYGHASATPESYMDTPVVNGVAYPVLNVDPKAYRMRFLNGANDRYWNLSLWVADSKTTSADGRTNTEVAMVPADGTSYTLANGSVVSVPNDLRPGGVPDPRTAGPNIIQFGNEAGFLPAPVIYTPKPMSLAQTSLLETGGGFYLGGAERGDTVIDFSQFAGKTLIVYNDSSAPVPGGDPRYDYYTGDADQTTAGGAASTLPGYGPNTRTVMQIVVSNAQPTPDYPVVAGGAYDVNALRTNLAAAYAASADAHILQTSALPAIDTAANTITLPGSSSPIAMKVKTIQGFTDPNFGRLIAQIGTELPNVVANTATALAYVDKPTDILSQDETQYWLIKNNDMDNHPMHFHLFNVQVLARIDQFTKVVKGPEPDEAGWKETVKNWPGEDVVVAMKPKTPQLPFGLPNSVRLMDPTLPGGATTNTALLPMGSTPLAFTQLDLSTGQAATVSNALTDYGWEYVWHCHILGHEENDLMRPMVYHPVINAPAAPGAVAVSSAGTVTWTDPTPSGTARGNAQNEIGFRVERAQVTNGVTGPFQPLPPASPVIDSRVNTLANVTSFQDAPAPFTDYSYQVVTVNEGGEGTSASALLSQAPAAPTGLTVSATAPSPSQPSQTTALATALPTTLTTANSLASRKWSVLLNWTDVATNETAYMVQRATATINASTGAVTWGAFSNQPVAGALLASNLTSYLDSAPNGGLYMYQVRAAKGPLLSAGATAMTATATTLPTPGQLQSGGASTSSAVYLQWQPVSSALGTGYEVQHCVGTAAQCTSGPLAIWISTPASMKAGLSGTTKVMESGLSAKTNYQFRVRTVNSQVPGLVSPWTAMFAAKTI